jgi:hypothetical protein
MGSHGGATEVGQVEVLRELGLGEDTLGAPIDASMDVAEVGRLSGGQPVYLANAALACDAVVPINRVKPHTEFRGPTESGLIKMLTIGLGKEAGASSLHAAGFEAFAEALPEAARFVLGKMRVPFGVALLEDRWHRLHRAEVVPEERLFDREPALLREAWANFARLPFPKLDVLVVREMGKTISGTGMDPNVTGRFPGKQLEAETVVQRLVVLDLIHSSGGNAVGVGLADIVTERLRSKIDWKTTYANAFASKALANAKLPIVAGTDLEAIMLAVGSLTGTGPAQPGIVAMANTLDVNHIAVSRPLLRVAQETGYAPAGPVCRAEFGEHGALLRIGGLEFFPRQVRPAGPTGIGPSRT